MKKLKKIFGGCQGSRDREVVLAGMSSFSDVGSTKTRGMAFGVELSGFKSKFHHLLTMSLGITLNVTESQFSLPR